MSYISLADRAKFSAPIKEILGILGDKNDNIYLRGECFGYVVNRIAKKFLGDPTYPNTSFNSTFFNESKKKSLSNAADSLAVLCNRADPIHSAGDLYFAISAVYQGFLGGAEGFELAPYGLQVYLRGIVERVLSTIETVNVGSTRDMAMTFRRHLIIRGVLADVVEAAKAFGYHDRPIWNDGKMILSQEDFDAACERETKSCGEVLQLEE
jgi:hypothetical protein